MFCVWLRLVNDETDEVEWIIEGKHLEAWEIGQAITLASHLYGPPWRVALVVRRP